MKRKDETSSTEEVEITPAMLEAGAVEFVRGDTDYFSEEEIVTKIYRAMEMARLLIYQD